MAKRHVVFLMLLVVLVFSISCKKIETAKPKIAGPLALQATRFGDAIPAEYGNLVGVTQNPQDVGWVGLWFQKPDQTITAVFVNVEQGRIYEKTLTIPRR
ncbi:MAG TPA: hypothetical protein VHR84_01220 [Terriglobales bacterium]|jgi:hypothetical protein|nr:hypothetical protein [Terriglobales bacterium]